ncbi:uncharacterized protein LOC135219305 isoform X2 [Macrobrachium nipponense]|uniref:uncharacterized protein LOC135219305 isoform X2 n=1 Tax=Macrobrachium nipponense TaxID=159736 RepID=UPI0030C89463
MARLIQGRRGELFIQSLYQLWVICVTEAMGGDEKQRLPVIDVGKLGLGNEPSLTDPDWLRVGKEIAAAFQHIGFVYLKGHGVPGGQVDQIVSAGAKFFDLSQEEKDKFPRDPDKQHGYVTIGRERFNGIHSYEIREAYDVKRTDGMFPDIAVPEFRPAAADFMDTCMKFTNRILIAMALGLDLDRNFFVDTHREIFSDNNTSCLRLLHYPPVALDISEGAIRCGAHTDYGTITLLFQDDMGGLYVRDRKGQWVSADPIPGTILVNVGDLLQFWTSDKLIATEHKVLIPEEEVCRRTCRRSTVFFVQPDDPVLIHPLYGASTFTPVTARDHILKRIRETYK